MLHYSRSSRHAARYFGVAEARFGLPDSGDAFASLARMFEAVNNANAIEAAPVYMDFCGAPLSWNWDGILTANDFNSYSGPNTRLCFRLQNAVGVTMDFTGARLKHGNNGGANSDEWATFVRCDNCSDITIKGGVFDFNVQPFAQGTISAVAGDQSYIDFGVDAGTSEPGFAKARRIELRNAEGIPIHFGAHRSYYSETPWTVTSQGGGVYRIGGMVAGDFSAHTWAVGNRIVIKAIDTGHDWFTFFRGDNITIDGPTCHGTIDAFLQADLAKNITVSKFKGIPRFNQPNCINVANRTFINIFSSGGFHHVKDSDFRWCGDDMVALGHFGLNDLTYVSATSFTGFAGSHFYNHSVPIGTAFVLYQGDFTEVARFTVTAIGAINGSTYKATYTVAVTSGALPTTMTDCWALTAAYTPEWDYSGNNSYACRGRHLLTSGNGKIRGSTMVGSNMSLYSCEFSDVNNNGPVKIDKGISITDSTFGKACLQPSYSYPAALQLRVSRMESTGSYMSNWSHTSAAFPVESVSVDGCTFFEMPRMTALFGACRDFAYTNNKHNNINTASVSSGSNASSVDIYHAVVGVVNSKDGRIERNKGRNLNNAEWAKSATQDAGAVTNVTAHDNERA